MKEPFQNPAFFVIPPRWRRRLPPLADYLWQKAGWPTAVPVNLILSAILATVLGLTIEVAGLAHCAYNFYLFDLCCKNPKS
jgi:hypothetical protein